MATLVSPTVDVAMSARAAALEYGDDGWARYTDDLREIPDEGLAAWVASLIAEADGAVMSDGHRVGRTHLWWVQDDVYLGRLNLYHRLTPRLRQIGGHIGYYVVPPHRGHGHASAMLSAGLTVASTLGIECALITCDIGNGSSRKVIENNGGLFQDERGGQLRFWVPTA